MKDSLIISDSLIKDKEAVRELLIQSYSQYEQKFLSSETWNKYLSDIKSSVDNPEVDRILVAKKNGEIIGALQLFLTSEKAYHRPELEIFSPIVRLLAVHPDHRGKGVAKQLLLTSLEYARSIGASHLYLHSSDIMQKAIALYEWLGFKRDESKEFYNQEVLVKCFRFDLEPGKIVS